MVNCVPLCGPLPTGKLLRSNRKVQEPSVTVPLASLPPESNVTGPTLVPLKLPNCKVNACPCGNPSTVVTAGPAPFGNAKDRLVRLLGVAEPVDSPLLPLHPRTVSVPMTTRAIHCAMRRGRAIGETVRGRVISFSFVRVLLGILFYPTILLQRCQKRVTDTARRSGGGEGSTADGAQRRKKDI